MNSKVDQDQDEEEREKRLTLQSLFVDFVVVDFLLFSNNKLIYFMCDV